MTHRYSQRHRSGEPPLTGHSIPRSRSIPRKQGTWPSHRKQRVGSNPPCEARCLEGVRRQIGSGSGLYPVYPDESCEIPSDPTFANLFPRRYRTHDDRRCRTHDHGRRRTRRAAGAGSSIVSPSRSRSDLGREARRPDPSPAKVASRPRQAAELPQCAAQTPIPCRSSLVSQPRS